MNSTQEMYDLMSMFEKVSGTLFYGHKVERYGRGENVPVGEFYKDGFVNQMFRAFMSGYQFHKCISRTDQTDQTDQ